MDFENRVEAFIRRQEIFPPGSRIVVACSGGPDSLALATVLMKLRERWNLSLRIAHFEHGIRGAASQADAEFVREFAATNGLPYSMGQEDIPAYARRARLSLETAARERRYAFLEQTARAMGEGALIALGHHADDQAETVLMRLLRGSGIDGLAAMRPRAGRLIRPLLFLSRQEIEAYVQEMGLSPRRDETNYLRDATRNRIRLELLPMLRQYSPAVDETLCRLAEAQAEAADYLQAATDAVWDTATTRRGNEVFILRDIYCGQPTAVRKAILRRIAEETGLRRMLGFTHYEALDMFCCDGETGKRLTLPQGYIAECRYDRILIRRMAENAASWEETPLALAGETRIEALGLTVFAFPWEKEKKVPDDAMTAVVDVDSVLRPLCVRGRKAGDDFRLESGGRQKVKSLLIDRKIPRALRDRVPIFTAGGEIFWVGGLRRAAVGLLEENTERVVAFHMVWDDTETRTGVYGKESDGHDDG